MKAADIAAHSLTDDEIVDLARFPLLEPEKSSREDYQLAQLLDALGKKGANPLALVTWPTGVKVCAMMRPGERTGPARVNLLAVYRAAETGHTGPVIVQVVK